MTEPARPPVRAPPPCEAPACDRITAQGDSPDFAGSLVADPPPTRPGIPGDGARRRPQATEPMRAAGGDVVS